MWDCTPHNNYNNNNNNLPKATSDFYLQCLYYSSSFLTLLKFYSKFKGLILKKAHLRTGLKSSMTHFDLMAKERQFDIVLKHICSEFICDTDVFVTMGIERSKSQTAGLMFLLGL